MTISNNKTSHLVSSQVPFFTRNDHPNFVRFLEAYYEWCEQEEKVMNRAKNVLTYQDIDQTIDAFSQHLYDTFMKFIPDDIIADKALVLKHIKDFYRAKGTEKSIRFLMRILYGDENVEFYYPKKDILKVSDGKWFIQQSLRITSTEVDDVPDDDIESLGKFVNTRITGETSDATAIVERIDRFYEQGTQIDELIISGINGDFINGETIIAYYDAEETTETLTATIFGGIINTITITNPGSLYEIGDPVILVSSTGTGACVSVTQVSTGNIASIVVVNGGAGYQNNSFLLFSGGGGSGANANVTGVFDDYTYHPNTYNIVFDTIEVEANTLLNNTVYSNLNSSNVSNTIEDATDAWVYANTGPAKLIYIITPGSGYSSSPGISIIANNRVQSLGILGRMEIVNAGTEYRIGDKIEFVNVPGGYGCGATANVMNVNSANANSITEVMFVEMSGHIIGGSGFDINYLPTTNVVTSTGSNANIAVTAILGAGAELQAANSTIGAIERVLIINRGLGYSVGNVTVDLTGSGDGLANANASVIEGVYSYPGRYLNDDGHISSYNFLEDRDYYQTFSYVVKVQRSINDYRQTLKTLIHPAGTKLFGEYINVDENAENVYSANASDSANSFGLLKSYVKTGNSVNVSYTSHGFSANANVYLEFLSGGYANVVNGIYIITTSSSNFFLSTSPLANTNNTSGNLEVSIFTA